MPRDFDSMLTARDRAWLAEIDRAVSAPTPPRHVVDATLYAAVLDANEFITQELYAMRGLQHKTHAAMSRWRCAAITLAVSVAALVELVIWEVSR